MEQNKQYQKLDKKCSTMVQRIKSLENQIEKSFGKIMLNINDIFRIYKNTMWRFKEAALRDQRNVWQ